MKKLLIFVAVVAAVIAAAVVLLDLFHPSICMTEDFTREDY